MKQSAREEINGIARFTTFACLLAMCTLLCACPASPNKPIPPLDPTKVAGKDKTAVTPTLPTKPGQVFRMPFGDLYQLVQGKAALIFDVRPSIFHKMGNIPGSISWPENAFERDLARHEPRIRSANSQNTPIVIYCTDLACPDAVTVATKLAVLGYSVSVLEGGYDTWKTAAP
jgi:rhodanese-related sulfurtransferase